jgi:hypothetical protein
LTKEDTGYEYHTHELQGDKNKFSLSIDQNSGGNYRICIANTRGYDYEHIRSMNVKLTINSDNMDEPNINEVVKESDVNPVKEKLLKTVSKAEQLLNLQKNEIDDEDKTASKLIKQTGNYYWFAVVQIIIILSISVYQVFSFKKFLKSKNLV